MEFLALVPLLDTNDMKRTKEWYQSVLGFKIAEQSPDEAWCRMERDDVALMFAHSDHPEPPHASAVQYIYVDDVMSLWTSIKDRCTAEWGPEKMDYGVVEFAIKDPNGYLLSFGQLED